MIFLISAYYFKLYNFVLEIYKKFDSYVWEIELKKVF